MNVKKRFPLAFRSIALAVAVSFFLMDIAYAAPEAGTAQALTPLQTVLQDPTRFEAPVEFAELKEVHRGRDKTFIIHIQDAHTNTSGEYNLAMALDEIMSKYRINLVLVEGGTKDDTLTPLKAIAPPEIWREVAKSFLMEGRISGEEYLNLISDHPMKIIGIEDRDLYMEGLEAYAALAERRGAVLEYLKKIRYALEKIKQKIYPEALLDYERSFVIARSPLPVRQAGKGDEAIYETKIASLISFARNDKLDLTPYPNLQKISALRESEKVVDFKLANLEQTALVEEIIKKGGGLDLKKHLEKIGKMKNQKAAQFATFQNTFDIAREKNIALDKYPNLLRHGENLKAFSEIDLEALLDEMERLEDEVYASRLPAEDGRLARAIDRYLGLLQTAYDIRMSAKEFTLFKTNEPDFDTVALLAFMNRKLMELGYAGDLIPHRDLLEDGKRSLEAFYDAVRRRDLVFIEKTQAILEKEKEQVAFLISGGYHTPHLKTLLKEKGYSYAVLTPLITSATNQARYEKLLLEPLRANNNSRAKETEAAGRRPWDYEILKAGERSESLSLIAQRAIARLEASEAFRRMSEEEKKEARAEAAHAAAHAALQILREPVPLEAPPVEEVHPPEPEVLPEITPVSPAPAEGARLAAAKNFWSALRRPLLALALIAMPAIFSVAAPRAFAQEERDIGPQRRSATFFEGIPGQERPTQGEILQWIEKATKGSHQMDRDQAERDLTFKAGKAAVPFLLEAFKKEKSGGAKRSLMRILGDIKDASTVPFLMKAMLEDEDEFVNADAARALAKMQVEDESVIPALIKVLGDEAESRFVRGAAAEILGGVRGDMQRPVLEALAEALKSRDVGVRRDAAFSLGELGMPDAAPHLIGALKDGDAGVRSKAARSLGKSNNLSAVPALIEALGDSDDIARSSAAKALGELMDPRAVPALIKTLEDKSFDGELRRFAAESLVKIGSINRHPNVVPALVEASRDKHTFVRHEAIRGLGEMKDPAALPVLSDALKLDPEGGVRSEAARAIGQIGTKVPLEPPVVEALMSAMQDPDSRVRSAAKSILETIGVLRVEQIKKETLVPEEKEVVEEDNWRLRVALWLFSIPFFSLLAILLFRFARSERFLRWALEGAKPNSKVAMMLIPLLAESAARSGSPQKTIRMLVGRYRAISGAIGVIYERRALLDALILVSAASFEHFKAVARTVAHDLVTAKDLADRNRLEELMIGLGAGAIPFLCMAGYEAEVLDDKHVSSSIYGVVLKLHQADPEGTMLEFKKAYQGFPSALQHFLEPLKLILETSENEKSTSKGIPKIEMDPAEVEELLASLQSTLIEVPAMSSAGIVEGVAFKSRLPRVAGGWMRREFDPASDRLVDIRYEFNTSEEIPKPNPRAHDIAARFRRFESLNFEVLPLLNKPDKTVADAYVLLQKMREMVGAYLNLFKGQPLDRPLEEVAIDPSDLEGGRAVAQIFLRVEADVKKALAGAAGLVPGSPFPPSIEAGIQRFDGDKTTQLIGVPAERYSRDVMDAISFAELVNIVHQKGVRNLSSMVAAVGGERHPCGVLLTSLELGRQIAVNLQYVEARLDPDSPTPLPMRYVVRAFAKGQAIHRQKALFDPSRALILSDAKLAIVGLPLGAHSARIQFSLMPVQEGGRVVVNYTDSGPSYAPGSDIRIKALARAFSAAGFKVNHSGYSLDAYFDKDSGASAIDELPEKLEFAIQALTSTKDLDLRINDGPLRDKEGAEELLAAYLRDNGYLRRASANAPATFGSLAVLVPNKVEDAMRQEAAALGLDVASGPSPVAGQRMLDWVNERRELLLSRGAMTRKETGEIEKNPAYEEAGRVSPVARILQRLADTDEAGIAQMKLVAMAAKNVEAYTHRTVIGAVGPYHVERLVLPLLGDQVTFYVLKDPRDGLFALGWAVLGEFFYDAPRRDHFRGLALPKNELNFDDLASLMKPQNFTLKEVPLAPFSLESLYQPPQSAQGVSPAALGGAVVSPGVTLGRVVINDPSKKAGDFEGGILVAPYTEPKDDPSIQSANGIVVTTGGALSHAAIRSREHKKPGLILYGTELSPAELKFKVFKGTERAGEFDFKGRPVRYFDLSDYGETQVAVKNGDLAFVDAENGVFYLIAPASEAASAEAFQKYEEWKEKVRAEGARLADISALEKLLVGVPNESVIKAMIQDLVHHGLVPAADLERVLAELVRQRPALKDGILGFLRRRAETTIREFQQNVADFGEVLRTTADLDQVYLRVDELTAQARQLEHMIQLANGNWVSAFTLGTLRQAIGGAIEGGKRWLAAYQEKLKEYAQRSQKDLPATLAALLRIAARLRLAGLSLEAVSPVLAEQIAALQKTREAEIAARAGRGILWKSELKDRFARPIAGGKASHAGEIVQAIETLKGLGVLPEGLEVFVPNGFVVQPEEYRLWKGGELDAQLKDQLTLAYRDLVIRQIESLTGFIQKDERTAARVKEDLLKGLSPLPLALAGVKSPETIDAVITMSRLTLQSILRTASPGDVSRSLRKRLEVLGSVAVRSSGLREDTEREAMAGMKETLLNVASAADLYKAIPQVWSSGAEAVLVDEMINAKASAVIFTADPVTRRTDRVRMIAAYGLNKGLVDQAVKHPDTYVFGKDPLGKGNYPLLSQEIGAKEQMVVLDLERGGTRIVPVSEDPAQAKVLQQAPALDSTQARHAAQVADALARFFGFHADVETSFDADDRLAILQVRPVTTIRESLERGRETLLGARLAATRREFMQATAHTLAGLAMGLGAPSVLRAQGLAQQVAEPVSFFIDKEKGVVKVKAGDKFLEKKDLTSVVYQPTADARHISYYTDGRMAELLAPLLPGNDPVLRRLGMAARGKDHGKTLTQELGIKNIRLYYLPIHFTKDIENTKAILAQVFKLYGIRVMAGHWAGLWNLPGSPEMAQDTPGARKNVVDSVTKQVELYGKEPWILYWQIGNENNYHVSGGQAAGTKALPMDLRTYYDFMTDLAVAVKQAETRIKAPKHPVLLGNGSLNANEAKLIDEFNKAKSAGLKGEAPWDGLALNLYPGVDFANETFSGEVGGLRDVFRLAQEIGLPAAIGETGIWAKDANDDLQVKYFEAIRPHLERNNWWPMLTVFEATNEPSKIYDRGRLVPGRRETEALFGILGKALHKGGLFNNWFKEVPGKEIWDPSRRAAYSDAVAQAHYLDYADPIVLKKGDVIRVQYSLEAGEMFGVQFIPVGADEATFSAMEIQKNAGGKDKTVEIILPQDVKIKRLVFQFGKSAYGTALNKDNQASITVKSVTHVPSGARLAAEIPFEVDYSKIKADYHRDLLNAILGNQAFVDESVRNIYPELEGRSIKRAVPVWHIGKGKDFFEIFFLFDNGESRSILFVAAEKHVIDGPRSGTEFAEKYKMVIRRDRSPGSEFTYRFGAEAGIGYEAKFASGLVLDKQYHVFSTDFIPGLTLDEVAGLIESIAGTPGYPSLPSRRPFFAVRSAEDIGSGLEKLVAAGVLAPQDRDAIMEAKRKFDETGDEQAMRAAVGLLHGLLLQLDRAAIETHFLFYKKTGLYQTDPRRNNIIFRKENGKWIFKLIDYEGMEEITSAKSAVEAFDIFENKFQPGYISGSVRPWFWTFTEGKEGFFDSVLSAYGKEEGLVLLGKARDAYRTSEWEFERRSPVLHHLEKYLQSKTIPTTGLKQIGARLAAVDQRAVTEVFQRVLRRGPSAEEMKAVQTELSPRRQEGAVKAATTIAGRILEKSPKVGQVVWGRIRPVVPRSAYEIAAFRVTHILDGYSPASTISVEYYHPSLNKWVKDPGRWNFGDFAWTPKEAAEKFAVRDKDIAPAPMLEETAPRRFTEIFGARLSQAFVGTAQAAQALPSQDPEAFVLLAMGLLSPEVAKKGIDEETPFLFLNVGNAVLKASLAADRGSGKVLFYDVNEKGETGAEPFAELPITPDMVRKAEERMRAAKTAMPAAQLEKELEKTPVLEVVSQITRAISLHTKAKDAVAPPADLETRPNVVAAVPIPDTGLDPREKQFIAKIFEALTPLFRSKVTLVFTSPRVFADKDKKTLELAEPAILPEGPYNVMVLSNPALPRLLENIEDAAGITPMPKSEIRGDSVEIGPYAIALLLADLIGSADDDGLQKLLQDTSIEQLLRQAMGAKYDIELEKDRAGIVKAIQSVDKEKRDFYFKIIFEKIRPLNYNQLLEVVRMVTQAVGAAA